MYLYFFLTAVVIAVFIMTMVANKHLHIEKWKLLVFSVAAVLIGVFCAKLMRLIEEGTWIGFSFYGAVFFEPLLMVIIGLLIKMKPSDVLDLGALTGCVTLIVLKIQCKITGCCFGKILRHLDNGRPVRFPSQIVEMVCGVILLVVMMIIIRSGKQKGYVYAWFMLLYGGSRFFLNMLRETTPFVLGMSAGCFWSLIAVIVGGSFLLYRKCKEKFTVSGEK